MRAARLQVLLGGQAEGTDDAVSLARCAALRPSAVVPPLEPSVALRGAVRAGRAIVIAAEMARDGEAFDLIADDLEQHAAEVSAYAAALRRRR